MKIEHLAIWVKDLEVMKDFYAKNFQMKVSDKYVNTVKGFSSYFLSFKNSSTRLELMHRNDITNRTENPSLSFGITHFAISVGSKMKVDQFTENFRSEGYKVIGEPRMTGDGYYESVIEDPEGNNVELTE